MCSPIQVLTPPRFLILLQILKNVLALVFLHLNVRSLIAKMDMLRIWVHSTDADVIVLSETWLNKSITDNDISINGYNVYRTDRPKRDGGVAIYVKKEEVSLLLSKSVAKQFEFLALEVEVSKSLFLTVSGCYRTLWSCIIFYCAAPFRV